MSDLEVDEKHKYYMSQAVKAIGIPKLKVIMAAELLIAGAIIISLSILKADVIYLFAFLGIVCGYVYSAPPLRVKKRGILSPLPVAFGLYFLPIVAGWFIVTNRLSGFILLFGLGYALIMQGITFINTCEDYEEDRISGIRTLAHVLGIRKTLLLGSIFVLIGGVTDLVLILFFKINLSETKFISFMLIPVLIVIFSGSIINISRNLFLISVSRNPLAVCKKEAFRMRTWFLATRYPLFSISLLLIF